MIGGSSLRAVWLCLVYSPSTGPLLLGRIASNRSLAFPTDFLGSHTVGISVHGIPTLIVRSTWSCWKGDRWEHPSGGLASLGVLSFD